MDVLVKEKAKELSKAVVDGVGSFFFELKHDLLEVKRTGFGVPRAVATAMNLSFTMYAFAGTTSIFADFAGKFYGVRECDRCNGWEGLMCKTCKGRGDVFFSMNKDVAQRLQNKSSASLAAAIVSGKVEGSHFPLDTNIPIPLPVTQCPSCSGTGVVTCTECKGDSWKGKLTMDRLFDPPSKAWNVYRVSTPPVNALKASAIMNPDLAKFEMFVRPEVETGVVIPKKTKKKMWWEFRRSQLYNVVRQRVAQRLPGWEQAQQIMMKLDPDRATTDPAFVPNIPLYRTVKATEDRVKNMKVPPRPLDWGSMENIMNPPPASSLKTEAAKKEWEELEEQQKKIKSTVLDREWEDHWRQEKLAESLANLADIDVSKEGLNRRKKLEVLPHSHFMAASREAKKRLVEESRRRSARLKMFKPKKPSQADMVEKEDQGSKLSTEEQKKQMEAERKRKEREEKRAMLERRAAERAEALLQAKAK